MKSAPFQKNDLLELGTLLAKADEVVAMREIAAGESDPLVIGLRHDVDNTLDGTLQLAEWEYEQGWRATYFILHDSPYWDAPELRSTLEQLAYWGHEIAIHVNALVEELRTGVPADVILERALDRLREWGHTITGAVAHGDSWCYKPGGELLFVNDEMFVECARPSVGAPQRTIVRSGRSIVLRPCSLADFDLTYDSNRLSRELYLSDSGGTWNDWDAITDRFPSSFGQLHMLVHPCWWPSAFKRQETIA